MNDETQTQLFSCFVVMPFSETEHTNGSQTIKTTAAEWDHIFSHWIKKAVESYQPHKFRCFRSAALPGNFVKGIVRDLCDTEIVIADLTGGRPNVYYELGIRHALETGTVMITQDLRSVPSDLKSYYCFEYKYTSEYHEYESHFQKFEKDLHGKIDHFFQNPGVSDNPVSDFIGHKNAFLEERFEREKNDLLFILENLFNAVESNYDVCEMLLKVKENQDPEGLIVLDFYPFDLLLSRFINTRWDMLPDEALENVRDAIETFRRMFLPIHQSWHILQINPKSSANRHFFDLVEAVAGTRNESMKKSGDDILAQVKKMSYTITYSPKPSNP